MLTDLLNIDMEFELAMLFGKKITNLRPMKDEVFKFFMGKGLCCSW